MNLSDMIQLERVKILEETDDHYKVLYRNNEWEIVKDEETHFLYRSHADSTHNISLNHSLKQSLTLDQRVIIPEIMVFQDQKVPEAFKEVMMFHELREIEYIRAGLDHAHERAMNDEVLYALKFFDDETREGYFKFILEARAEVRSPYYEDSNYGMSLQGIYLKPEDYKSFKQKDIPIWVIRFDGNNSEVEENSLNFDRMLLREKLGSQEIEDWYLGYLFYTDDISEFVGTLKRCRKEGFLNGNTVIYIDRNAERIGKFREFFDGTSDLVAINETEISREELYSMIYSKISEVLLNTDVAPSTK